MNEGEQWNKEIKYQYRQNIHKSSVSMAMVDITLPPPHTLINTRYYVLLHEYIMKLTFKGSLHSRNAPREDLYGCVTWLWKCFMALMMSLVYAMRLRVAFQNKYCFAIYKFILPLVSSYFIKLTKLMKLTPTAAQYAETWGWMFNKASPLLSICNAVSALKQMWTCHHLPSATMLKEGRKEGREGRKEGFNVLMIVIQSNEY